MRLPFLPPQATNMAGEVDTIFIVLLALTVFFASIVFALVIMAAVRYRRRAHGDIGQPLKLKSSKPEWGGMAFLGVLAFGMFLWSGATYVRMFNPPADAVPVFVTGRMWMWKAQHENGVREQNALHVEVGKPVKLIMTSEDVIHSFYVPAFRIHTDLVPGRYTTQWFTPTEVGSYRLLCSEYCGTGHGIMGGEVVVMNSADFQAWMTSMGGSGATGAVAGEQLFQAQGCIACHTGVQGAPAPKLAGLFGTQVTLESGQTVTADANYIQESILNPTAKVHKGYQPIMPSYQGRLSEEQVFALVQYVESLGEGGAAAPGPTPAGTATP